MFRIRLAAVLTAGWALFGLVVPAMAGPPPSTRPVEGLREHTPNVHALTGVRIVAAPGRVIPRGTIVVRDGVIEAAGADVEVPGDARVWKLDGKTVYAGLIDCYSRFSGDQEPQSGGASHWNSLVRPQRDVAGAYRSDKSLGAGFRSQGVTCRLAVPDSGVIKGTSALVTTGDGPADQTVIEGRVALHLHLSVDRRRESYPKSPMGAMALARQAFCDADWHRRVWKAYRADPTLPRPERNDSLGRLQDYLDGDRLVIIDAADEQYVLRADRFAREFALKAAIRGSGREYRRLEAIRATGRAIIVPLGFPKPPEVGTPEAALDVTLEELMHWDLAPENPARLADAGVRILLTAHGLDSPKEFLPAVRKAVARGLAAEAALRALTTEPAALLGVDDRLGTVEAGKAAHLVVTDGELFAEKTRVLQTWVDGRRYEIEPSPAIDVRGSWRVTLSTRPPQVLLIAITGKPEKLEATLQKAATVGRAGATTDSEKDRDKQDPDPKEPDKKDAAKEDPAPTKLKTLTFRAGRLGGTFDGKLLGRQGIVRLSAVVSAAADGRLDWLGDVHWPDGSRTPIRAEPVDPSAKPEKEKPQDKPKPPEPRASFPVNYPLGAFGRQGPPEQPRLLVFRNATVWTCDRQGVLPGGSVLIGGGRIIAVGRKLKVPPEAVVVDCSGRHVTPGVIDCHSHMATDGGGNESGQAISSEVRIGDFLDAGQISIYRQLAGGVTASHVLHGSSNPIGGQNQLIKLRWGALPGELKFAEAPPTLKLALGENVKQSNRGERYTTRYPQTRMGVEQIIRDAFQAAVEYQKQWERWRRTGRGLPPRRDLELEPLVEVLKQQRWVHCHAYRQDEVLAVLRALDDFGVRGVCLQHILEGYKVADAMARYGASGSAFSDWWAYKFEVYDAIPYNGALMHGAGVLVSFNSDSRELARHLNLEAAKAVKYGGLRPQEALKFVTLNAARQLRVQQHVGSLAPGKQADLAVWSGPPLSNFSRCQQTWIDGRKYFDIREDLRLREEARQRHATLVQKVLGGGRDKAESGQKDR